MDFKINPIKPSMSHEEKVYEYARRIAHYSKTASEERESSKIFKCENILRNLEYSGKHCGCFSNEIALREFPLNPCKPCTMAHSHYLAFRSAKAKQGAAMRQLANEMNKNGKDT